MPHKCIFIVDISAEIIQFSSSSIGFYMYQELFLQGVFLQELFLQELFLQELFLQELFIQESKPQTQAGPPLPSVMFFPLIIMCCIQCH